MLDTHLWVTSVRPVTQAVRKTSGLSGHTTSPVHQGQPVRLRPDPKTIIPLLQSAGGAYELRSPSFPSIPPHARPAPTPLSLSLSHTHTHSNTLSLSLTHTHTHTHTHTINIGAENTSRFIPRSVRPSLFQVLAAPSRPQFHHPQRHQQRRQPSSGSFSGFWPTGVPPCDARPVPSCLQPARHNDDTDRALPIGCEPCLVQVNTAETQGTSPRKSRDQFHTVYIFIYFFSYFLSFLSPCRCLSHRSHCVYFFFSSVLSFVSLCRCLPLRSRFPSRLVRCDSYSCLWCLLTAVYDVLESCWLLTSAVDSRAFV